MDVKKITALKNALAVVVLDHRIREYLELYDPKAFEQAEAALTGYDAGSWVDHEFTKPVRLGKRRKLVDRLRRFRRAKSGLRISGRLPFV